ncbi:citrate lyase holo-[acyl-carrier protein] synthase [Vagococcus hydrophili]|uniref:citrate lyase holo-[acyl-carrier protein] synthase n=1 Tax=Vagococcus hydrophili TaxID=2714947 RepID=A0A6G8AUE4_9ENTE|nr:citrate lyase holo-[acyl-carrier protein] synthase [Vagococcus hydrophili]QIL48607.1 citrate lyase holo-[acyl-carrier protein] synthase [Vagococcus hydrophili]
MIFGSGVEQTVEDMLRHREQRMMFQKKLLNDNEEVTLISYTMNIPGPIKNNSAIFEMFNYGFGLIEQALKNEKVEIIYQKIIQLPSGNDGFFLVKELPIPVKELTMKLEEQSEFGRLLDIDILSIEQEELIQVSRSHFKENPRKCLLCSADAKNCARSRKHSVEELQIKINEIYERMT